MTCTPVASPGPLFVTVIVYSMALLDRSSIPPPVLTSSKSRSINSSPQSMVFTKTVTVSVRTQPFKVTNTVYSVVSVGAATGLDTVELFNPVAGAQK